MNLSPVRFKVLDDILNRLSESSVQIFTGRFSQAFTMPSAEFVAVERLVAAVTFDHQQIRPLDLLVGREPIFTIQTNRRRRIPEQ